MCTNGTQVPCEVPSLPNPSTRKGWPHNWGLQPLLFLKSDMGSFTSRKNKSVKVLRDGTYGFSSLSEKTRNSNNLQMSLQRQNVLLSYLNNWSQSKLKKLWRVSSKHVILSSWYALFQVVSKVLHTVVHTANIGIKPCLDEDKNNGKF